MQVKISNFGLAKELPTLPVGHSYARIDLSGVHVVTWPMCIMMDN